MKVTTANETNLRIIIAKVLNEQFNRSDIRFSAQDRSDANTAAYQAFIKAIRSVGSGSGRSKGSKVGSFYVEVQLNSASYNPSNETFDVKEGTFEVYTKLADI